MRIDRIESIDGLADFKAQYVQQATAPLDGMWLCGFVPMAAHFGIYDHDQLVGYYCVNDEGYLLQFIVDETRQNESSRLFASIVQGGEASSGAVKGAFVSTAEPHYFSLCLDSFSRFEVNALMYQHLGGHGVGRAGDQSLDNRTLITAIELTQLSDAVDFAVEAIGAPAEWLNGYFSNLINRGELFGSWQSGKLIATGESRGYDDYQTEYADLGVIVAKANRGQGVATQILRQLVSQNTANGLKSICSTEVKNIAAKTAIGRVGFVANNRIIQFHV